MKTARETRESMLKVLKPNGSLSKVDEEIEYGITQGWLFIETFEKLGAYEKIYLAQKGYHVSYDTCRMVFIISWSNLIGY